MKQVIIISVVAVIIVVIILLTSKQSASAQTQTGLQGQGYVPPGQFIPQGGYGQIPGSSPVIDLIDQASSFPMSPGECRKTCRLLCKPLKGKSKRTCKRRCKSDCAKGKEITSIYP